MFFINFYQKIKIKKALKKFKLDDNIQEFFEATKNYKLKNFKGL